MTVFIKRTETIFFLWLLNKQINTIYVSEIDNTTICYFQKIGVAVKPHREIKECPIFNELE